VGFDYGRPGAVLLLQFKLGQWLERFRRTNKSDSFPDLDRPFWRFWINTAEPGGQYDTLLISEYRGAEVYYSAPRFRDWSQYLSAFEADEVLERSLLIKPSQIRQALDEQRAADGHHRIAYDSTRVHVCSEPVSLQETRPADLAQQVGRQIAERKEPLSHHLFEIFSALESRTAFRREIESARLPESTSEPSLLVGSAYPELSGFDAEAARKQRVQRLLARAESEEHATAAALAIETWSLGIQMILATRM
jgi:hypothetical protein